ncbi:MAG: hypothetical protein JF614_12470 [Acidobacteria bacterium]|nr:hypothetical protein [Acidobacteriota bacterium]
MSDPFKFALGVLCVWRITHLLAAEDGPGDILVRFRRSLGDGFWGTLLDCFYCLSLWIAIPVALLIGQDWSTRCLLWFALSAAAILIERITPRLAASPATFVEDKEVSDELLRKTEDVDSVLSSERDRE